MKDGVITDAQFDALSKENVLHWVSAHIIPVSTQQLRRKECRSLYLSQDSPISLTSGQAYNTMLRKKQVSFKQVDSDEKVPEWSRVRLNDDVRLIVMKEVRL